MTTDYVHLRRIRRDAAAKAGWCHASVCNRIEVASDLRNLTDQEDKVTCPLCWRWMVRDSSAPLYAQHEGA